MDISLRFLGAAGTVTGSRHLLTIGDARVLVDCGLFQGFKRLRLKNWAPFPVAPPQIDAVILTHAHIDHSGYLPLLVRNGFRGPILCTDATRDLCQILLPDSGFLQEKDAERANRYGYTKHKPALPLYTKQDAEICLEAFAPRPFRQSFEVLPGITAQMRPAGHILGAATVELRAAGRTIVFSGDLGRYDSATMPDAEPVPAADVLVVESTYGNRVHAPADPEDEIAAVVRETAARGGTVLIPAFAVGRAQSLLFHLARLKQDGRIPHIPVFLDSPMAVNASDVFCDHLADHRLSAEECHAACDVATYIRTPDESRALNETEMPKVIISASGMATGGRVLHHLNVYAPDSRNTILFAGFQAGGTRGAAMVAGADRIKIHGAYVPIRAEVQNLGMLSAHADRDEILRWLRGFTASPSKVFIVHGEPDASEALRVAIGDELGWDCDVPGLFDEAGL
jgi:metallo-beta-lactamase family protein